MTSIPSSRADLARRTLRAAGVGLSAKSDAELRHELATSRPLAISSARRPESRNAS